MARDTTQVVEHLPSKCKALVLKPSTRKKERKKERETENKIWYLSPI
jgi:hypothetical protein